MEHSNNLNHKESAVLSKEQQLVQELVSHPGWEIYKALVMNGFKTRLQNDLQAAARSGEPIRSAAFAGQIDILPKVLEVPINYLKEPNRGR